MYGLPVEGHENQHILFVYLLQNTDELRFTIVETLLMLNPTGNSSSYFDAADGIVEVERRLSQVSLDVCLSFDSFIEKITVCVRFERL